MEIAFKWRERRWQHREETMATNREREAERDLDVREKQIRDREIMARKLAEWAMTLKLIAVKKNITKTDPVGGSIDNREELDENVLSKKLQTTEDLIKEMMMTLDEESELFVKKEIMAYVNF
ncbi:unnamed protein product [Rhizophagus irregularis]|nr:unnamed protein product [Rhizophagus irregularis]